MTTDDEGLSFGRLHIVPRLNDYAQLTKARVTTLIIITAWCGFYFGAHQAGVPVWSWALLHALIGIGLVSSGTAALNEVMESDVDAKMRRTARRPIPSGRMSLLHATLVGALLAIGGSIYLVFLTNWLTGLLTFLTSLVYLLAYTPLKKVSPICTFVGAFPGAMPGVLGWTAARGRLDWGTLALFAILFLWQFPHFFAIAWIYREDYARGSIRMLPVVDPKGRSTSLRMVLYSLLLVPVSLAPAWLGMAGRIYIVGAVVLGLAFVYFAVRVMTLHLPVTDSRSRMPARQLFRCSILYLPLLLALMVANSSRGVAQEQKAAPPKAGDQKTIVGCLTGYDDRYTIGASDDMLYLLEGDPAMFKRYNAKMVRATGTVTEPGPGTSKHDVLSQQPPTLKVTSLKKVADGCN